MIEIDVAAEADGKRLDALLKGIPCPEVGPLSQKKARLLCAVGAVAIDGVVARGTARVRVNQRVSFTAEHVAETLLVGLPCAFADDSMLVLHKPPGLAVHAGPLVEDSVADRLQRNLPGAGLAQRLDREASGLLLVGRTAEALRQLGDAMESGAIERNYEAIVHGTIVDDERTIDLPLRVTDEPRGDRPKTIVAEDGQRSVSHLRVLARHRGATLVGVRLETGRTHQIRAHLAAVGFPILGDPRYGNREANERARQTHGVHRTLLHGARLVAPHPDDGREIAVTAAREPDFARLLPRARP